MAREQTTTSSGGRRETNGGDRDRDQNRNQTGELANKTHEAAEQVRQTALERVESVRQSSQTAKERTAERVRKLSSTVRKVGEHMRIEDQHYIADKAGQAGERLESIAEYLNSADVSTILKDTGTWARGNPAAFYGSAFIVGLAAGRFLKAGSPSSSASSPVTSTPPVQGGRGAER